MKKLNSISFLLYAFTIFTISSCDLDTLSDLDRDILGEWVVDDYVLSGENIAENGVIQDMHMIFDDNYNIELSWFENADFFIVDGTWSSDESNATIDFNLENDVFFFCNDDRIELSIFFFAGDMELDTDCGSDWMEIQLERL